MIRLWSLLSAVAPDPLSADELADRLGLETAEPSSRTRTLRRDLAVLTGLGVGVERVGRGRLTRYRLVTNELPVVCANCGERVRPASTRSLGIRQ
jgi:predicted DNA-binding transcriptional regulator YafY